jgi:hypothetical protein
MHSSIRRHAAIVAAGLFAAFAAPVRFLLQLRLREPGDRRGDLGVHQQRLRPQRRHQHEGEHPAGWLRVDEELSLLSTAWIDKPVVNVPGRNPNTDVRWQVDAITKF